MCLVLSWYNGLAAIFKAALLLQNRIHGELDATPMSCNTPTIQVISHHVDFMALYSASADERNIVFCFFVFKEIKESSNLM